MLPNQKTKKILIVMCLSLCSVSKAAEKPERPNIVFIMAEDIANDLACYGTPGVKTPTVDALAEKGLRYARFYTNNPMCSPSRTSIMLGLYPTTCGGQDHRRVVIAKNAKWKYLTHYLKNAGYACRIGGYFGGSSAKTDINVKAGKLHKDDPLKEPFFQQITLKATHRECNDRWQTFRKNAKNPVKVEDVAIPPFLPDIPEVREDWATYLDLLQEVDRQTQVILDDLKKKGFLENTVIIWIGDNGRAQVHGKCYLFEDGIRCPMIIAGKGIPEGKVVDDLVSGIDVTATILALAGIDKPSHMQGQAFLNNPDYKPKDYVFATRDRGGNVVDCSRTIVGKRFKYIHNFMPEVPFDARNAYMENIHVRPILPLLRKMNKEGKLTPEQAYFFKPTKDREQLYDLEKDPFELKNLVDDPQYQEQKETLRKRLFTWIEETGDVALKKNQAGEWVPVAGKAGKKK